VAKLTPEEYMNYLKTFYAYNDWDNCLATAKREAAEEGRAEGRVKGIAEGRAEGKAEGKAEAIEFVVLQANRNGFTIEQIQSLTRLPEEQIIEILNRF